MKKYAYSLILLTLFAFVANAQDQQKVEQPPISALKSEKDIPCKIIRKINYPITKTEPYKQPLRIALLNVCPSNPGMEARPMMSFFVNNEMVMREYVVEQVFKNVKEAKKYAKKNNITDASF